MRRLFPFLILLIIIYGCVWADEKNLAMRTALNELTEKAQGGDAKALFELARLHETGYDSIPRDTARSIALYLLSAQKGYAPAQNFIGFCYYNGRGVKQATDSALYWIRKAGEAGDITAAANLGYLLTEGENIERDFEEANKWLAVATEAGVKEAQEKFVELNEATWRGWPIDSVLYNGIRYYTHKAPIAGVALLELAAEKNIPQALALLGDAYSKGLGTVYDHEKSITFFKKAALEGDPSAQFILGELLEFFPETLTQDSVKSEFGAEYWFDKAAEKGVNDAEKAYQLLYSLPQSEQNQ